MSKYPNHPPDKVMREPWFHSTAGSGSIRSGLRDGAESVFNRPLREGERRLGSFILPPFQRGEVWSTTQKQEFVDSIWDGLPIGNYTLNVEPGIGDDMFSGWLLDGQQRWTAILDYVDDEFALDGIYFSELPVAQQRGFKSKPFACSECKLATYEECEKVYRKLAYGGTAHLPEHVSSENWDEIGQLLDDAVANSGRGPELADALDYLRSRLGLHAIAEYGGMKP